MFTYLLTYLLIITPALDRRLERRRRAKSQVV